MKTLEIQVPEGHEIDKETSTFERIVFKCIKQKRWNAGWEDIQALNIGNGKTQYWLEPCGEIEECKMSDTDYDDAIKDSRSHLPDHRTAERVRALCQLYIIAEYYNEGWKPDWTDNDQSRYYPAYYLGNIVVIGAVTAGKHSIGLPAFKSEEVIYEAYKHNKEIFETAFKP